MAWIVKQRPAELQLWHGYGCNTTVVTASRIERSSRIGGRRARAYVSVQEEEMGKVLG